MIHARRIEVRRRVGFTLIEAVVCLAVIGILAALVLSALQSARGASRRLGCLRNLQQIGVALNSYRAAINGFPAAKHGRAFSIHSMLLPYLDQTPLYHSINFDTFPKPVSRWGRQNHTVYFESVGVFICPEDRDDRPGGATSYAGNRGTGTQKYGYNGAFSKTMTADFKDGMSTTVAFAEWVVGQKGLPSRREPSRLVFATGRVLIEPREFDEFVKLCSKADPLQGRLSPLVKGESWLLGELSFTLYNHVITLNGYSCTNHDLIQEGAFTAGSLHGRGANLMFADGHAAFLGDSLDIEVWRALGSREGGEPITSDLP